MNIISEITNKYLRNDLPKLEIGDEIKVFIKTTEIIKKKGKKEEKFRFTKFEGIVIAKRNEKLISYTFSLLKENKNIVTTIIFLYNSPLISKIEKIGKIKVRRAKLFFLERELYAKKEDN